MRPDLGPSRFMARTSATGCWRCWNSRRRQAKLAGTVRRWPPALNGSVHAVWRVLRHEGICLQRQRSWCVSTDKEFAAKAADIVGLYLNPPEKALVISVDEKPSIQALERKTGYVETDNGKIVRGLQEHLQTPRHAQPVRRAWQWPRDEVKTAITQLKRREEFLQFMDQVVAETPAGSGIACDFGQLLHAQEMRRLAGHAPQRPFSLHAHLGQLAQSSGDLVRHPVAQGAARPQRQEHGRIAPSH